MSPNTPNPSPAGPRPAANERPVAFAAGTWLPSPSPQRSSFLRTWARRAVSISLFTALFALLWALLPALLVVGWLIDRARKKPVVVRASLFFAVYLLFEMIGITMTLIIWIASGTWLGASRHRLLRWTFALQCFWLRSLFNAARRLFRWRVLVTGDDAVARGNILFFIRHVSTADTALAGVFVSDRHGIVLRYVLKSELLWDPCVDIVGNRLPNGFVRRGRGTSEQAVAEVVRLTEHLGPADGVLIYPEGTRFTPAKRARLLERVEQMHDLEQLERARSLHNVLPPKLAGALALLEHAETADVVFCAHSGFEKALGFHQFMAGALSDLTVRIHFFRVARHDIPEPREQRIAWLHEQWRQVDAWVARSSDGSSARDSDRHPDRNSDEDATGA